MTCRKRLVTAASAAVLGMATFVGSRVIAADPPAKDAKPAAQAPAGQPEIKLPPGWTMEDMQACMIAGTPGKVHERLAKEVGTWAGKTSMFMPGSIEPMKGECTMTVTSLLGGRYIKGEMSGEMPGMGPYSGEGVTGFDNVSQKLVSTWIDSQSTGIMQGTGEASADGKTLKWAFNYNCPITKKLVVMRQVETITGADTKTLEMFGPDPKSGKEYQMMRIEFTRKK